MRRGARAAEDGAAASDVLGCLPSPRRQIAPAAATARAVATGLATGRGARAGRSGDGAAGNLRNRPLVASGRAGLVMEQRQVRQICRTVTTAPAADLALLAAEVSALRSRLEVLEAVEAERRRRRLLPDDPGLLAKLLPVISGRWGDETFCVRHVLEDPRVAPFAAGRSVKALGKLFARAAGVPIGAYVLVDCGWDDEVGVRRWRVDGVSRGL